MWNNSILRNVKQQLYLFHRYPFKKLEPSTKTKKQKTKQKKPSQKTVKQKS